MKTITRCTKWDEHIAPSHLRGIEHLSSSTYVRFPDIPEQEMLQFRRIRTRVAMMAESGIDIEPICNEQFTAAAQVWQQKSKIVVSRFEFDQEIDC